MEILFQSMQIKVSERTYLKNPENSELGKRILREGHRMLEELGFEHFTFKKLAEKTGTTESSVYRYFESKHQFLIYLLNWYWSYLEYQLVFHTLKLKSPTEKLKRAIELINETQPKSVKDSFDLATLQKIAVNESAKAYLTQEVDKKNTEGCYHSYKRLCSRFAEILMEINPRFTYAQTTAALIVDGISQQKFYREHLPALSNFTRDGKNSTEFFFHLALNATQLKKKL
jgi:AcrR family transcriptional regulator